MKEKTLTKKLRCPYCKAIFMVNYTDEATREDISEGIKVLRHELDHHCHKEHNINAS